MSQFKFQNRKDVQVKTNDQKPQIVVVDDDSDVQDLVTAYFKTKGYSVECYSDSSEALKASRSLNCQWDVLLTNYHFSNMSAVDFTLELHKNCPQIPIILMTPQDSSDAVIEMIGKGAYDFIEKPIRFPQLLISVERALKLKSLNGNLNELRDSAKSGPSSNRKIIGKSPRFLEALELAQKVASSNANIFITGESGTGKEIFAKYIHSESKRSKGPFVAINCSAIPEALLESELFGHAKGSFTGAQDKRIGLFEEAQDGTLFLDEIGDLSSSLQAKLLRVLQDKKIKRVGENNYRTMNCRIISATHKDLALEVNENRFREDLYFRLNVIPIAIPPLRERQEDLVPLAESFLKKFALENASVAKTFSKDTLKFILENPWRGNVRELENAVERAVVLSTQSEISFDDFVPLTKGLYANGNQPDLSHLSNTFSIHYAENLPTLDDVINKYIEFAVMQKGGARDKTAKEIGIDRKTLYKRLRPESNLFI